MSMYLFAGQIISGLAGMKPEDAVVMLVFWGAMSGVYVSATGTRLAPAPVLWIVVGMAVQSLLMHILPPAVTHHTEMVSYWISDPAHPVTSRAASLLLDSMTLGAAKPDVPYIIMKRAGLAHVMAISGLHVGIAAAIGMVAGRLVHRLAAARYPLRRCPVEGTGGVASLTVYLSVVHDSPSVQRAAIMAVTYFLLRCRTKTGGLNALAIAGITILTLWPHEVHSLSFQLSFFATAGLVLAMDTVQGRVSKIVAASSGAWLSTWPIAVHSFGQISVWGPLANLTVLPVFTVLVIPGAFLVRIMRFLHIPGHGVLHVYLTDLTAGVLNNLHVFMAAHPMPSCHGAVPAIAALSLFLAARRKLISLLGMGVYVLLVFMPVGGADSIVMMAQPGRQAVIFTHQRSAVVVDAGPSTVPDMLRNQGTGEVRELIVSHCHRDHYRMVRPLVGSVLVRRVVYRPALPCPDMSVRTVRVLDSRPLPGMFIYTLDGYAPAWLSENDSSTVLLVRWHGLNVALPGDLEYDGWERIACPERPVDLMVMPHHGSRHSISPRMFSCLKPRQAIVLGRDNAPQLLEIINKFNIPAYLVKSGSVVVRGAGLEPARRLDTGT